MSCTNRCMPNPAGNLKYHCSQSVACCLAAASDQRRAFLQRSGSSGRLATGVGREDRQNLYERQRADMNATSAPAAGQRTGGPEMEGLHEITESLNTRSESHRLAVRNAIARRKLEQMREEKALHWFITDVWDEPPETSPEGG